MTAGAVGAVGALVERLEAATEGSRELDAEIDLLALDLGWRAERHTRGTPNYTTSIDAALSLVPDNWSIWALMIWRGESSTVTAMETEFKPGFGHAHSGGMGRVETKASTPALALCIAALRARQEKT